MPFELPTPTTARIIEVLVLADKHREPDTHPGVALDLAITTGNGILAHFDGALRGMLYCRNASTPHQATLDGVEPVSDLPNLTQIGRRLGAFRWDAEFTGYAMTIERGLGGSGSDIELEHCRLSNFSIAPREGGSVVLKLRVESPNVGERLHGQLAVLKTTECPITLVAPEVAPSLAFDSEPRRYGRPSAKELQ